MSNTETRTVNIKVGAVIFQDMRFHRWTKAVAGINFTAERTGSGNEQDEPRWKLTAHGYGQRGNYGNGAVFCYGADIEDAVSDEMRQAFTGVEPSQRREEG